MARKSLTPWEITLKHKRSEKIENLNTNVVREHYKTRKEKNMENEVTTNVTDNAQEGQTQEVQSPDNGTENETAEAAVERLKAELEAEKAVSKAEKTQRQKDKAALDKALKDVARLTKESREKMSEAEIEAQEKRLEAERLQEEIEELRAYRKKNEAKERYLLQGMSAELAVEAADAEVAGDMDKLADIQHKHTDAILKAKEAEWKASRPRVNAGDGSVSMTKEEIMKISDKKQRLEAIARNIDQFQ